MKKENARKFRYILVAIASIILVYDLVVQSWLGASSMVLLIVAMLLSDINEAKEKRSKKS